MNIMSWVAGQDFQKPVNPTQLICLFFLGYVFCFFIVINFYILVHLFK